jgi:hypothetical protein
LNRRYWWNSRIGTISVFFEDARSLGGILSQDKESSLLDRLRAWLGW